MFRPAINALLPALVLVGCARIDRTITVNSEPENALVYLNDQEIGRTPVTRTFKWYGTYDVEVRKDGYETLKTSAPVIAPGGRFRRSISLLSFLPLSSRIIALSPIPSASRQKLRKIPRQ